MNKTKSCLDCWTGEFEPQLCDECERFPRLFPDHWKPNEEEENEEK